MILEDYDGAIKKSVFSWSFSAAEDFEQCRRRRYWSKYAMWGDGKLPLRMSRKTAYRLLKWIIDGG